MARRCKNKYRDCQNNAVKDTGRAYVDNLCADCLARRKAKQALTAAQPICACGNKMPLGGIECGGCKFRREMLERGLTFS